MPWTSPSWEALGIKNHHAATWQRAVSNGSPSPSASKQIKFTSPFQQTHPSNHQGNSKWTCPACSIILFQSSPFPTLFLVIGRAVHHTHAMHLVHLAPQSRENRQQVASKKPDLSQLIFVSFRVANKKVSFGWLLFFDSPRTSSTTRSRLSRRSSGDSHSGTASPVQ